MQSIFFTSLFLGIFIKNATGNANSILAILEPTIFPIVMPSNPLIAAFTDIASSGAEVPNATRVIATIKGCIFKFLAREVAPFTSHSPLK